MIKFTERSKAQLLVIGVYIAALTLGLVIFRLYRGDILFASFAGDLAATLLVWFVGVLLRNASLYDPYWSAAPIIIVPGWISLRGTAVSFTDVLFMIAVFIWGIRLTTNWAMGWSGLKQQDWRYTMLKNKSGNLYFLVNLMGINIMPTVLVFFGLLPAYYAIHSGQGGNFISYIGFVVCVCAAILQHFADKQMRRFKTRKDNGGKCIDEDLWRYSRHPNYFGEVSFWWGIWFIQIGIVPQLWKTVIGPMLMTLLFVFISIPMMEEHVIAARPSYLEYKRQVSMLIPWVRRSK